MSTNKKAFPVVIIYPEMWLEVAQLDGADRLRAMQNACEARYITKVTAGDYDLWVDEEGIHTGQPLNLVGSALAHHLSGGRAHRLFGPMLITRAPQGYDADVQPLTGHDVEHLAAIHAAFARVQPDQDDD